MTEADLRTESDVTTEPDATIAPDVDDYPDTTIGIEPPSDAGGNGFSGDPHQGDAPVTATPASGGAMSIEPPWWQRPVQPVTPRHVVVAIGAWLVVTLIAVMLVLYGVGPMLEQRDQRSLLGAYRTDIRHAAAEEVSLDIGGPETEAPDFGDPVAILDIGALHFEQVVVEGVGPQQTRRGPGHVPGTGGLGQPGNSAVVARRSAFGGLFGEIAKLRRGTEILVTTTQGQSVYEVATVRRVRLRDDEDVEPSFEEAETSTTSTSAAPAPEGGSTTSTTEATTSSTTPASRMLPRGHSLTTEDVYGPSEDDRLTLVTSASSRPWATEEAVVVVARMKDRPFEPTPQNGRTEDDDGRSRDGGATAPMLLAALAYAIAVGAAIVLYRRARPRSAYLLTAPPMLAGVVLTAETVARLLPAWF